MARLRWLAFGCVAVLTSACAFEAGSEPTPAASELGPPVALKGAVYTPASIGSRGCVLYRVSIPGGRAPAALMYRSMDGEFAFGRPECCVAATFAQHDSGKAGFSVARRFVVSSRPIRQAESAATRNAGSCPGTRPVTSMPN